MSGWWWESARVLIMSTRVRLRNADRPFIKQLKLIGCGRQDGIKIPHLEGDNEMCVRCGRWLSKYRWLRSEEHLSRVTREQRERMHQAMWQWIDEPKQYRRFTSWSGMTVKAPGQ